MDKDIDDWRWVAEQLGKVVQAFLEEFDEMCRGSDNEEAALKALAELESLQ